MFNRDFNILHSHKKASQAQKQSSQPDLYNVIKISIEIPTQLGPYSSTDRHVQEKE